MPPSSWRSRALASQAIRLVSLAAAFAHSHAAQAKGAAADAAQWAIREDPTLTALIEEALGANQDINIALQRVAQARLDHPTPWARSASTSFLSTPEETRRDLLGAGFDVIRLRSTLKKTLAFGERSRAFQRGEKPLRRAAMRMDREIASQPIASS